MSRLYLKSISVNGASIFRRSPAIQSFAFKRKYAIPIPKKLKQFNNQLNKITDEKSQESIKTLKYLRLVGAFSIIFVFCSIMWASTLTEPVREEIVIQDLGKDVRDAE